MLKKFGWLEEAVGKEGTKVTWLYSEGSNKANELVSSGSADLASTAGAAALLARTNGVPLKIVFEMHLLLEVAARARTTVLLVTHDVEEALRVAGRLVVLGGRPARLTLDAVVPGTARARPSRPGSPRSVTGRSRRSPRDLD